MQPAPSTSHPSLWLRLHLADRASSFSGFNIFQIGLLVGCLVVCLFEHQLHVTDQVEAAIHLNRVFRWAFPFGYYPMLLLAIFIWGFHRHSSAPWWLLGFGYAALTIVCLYLVGRGFVL